MPTEHDDQKPQGKNPNSDALTCYQQAIALYMTEGSCIWSKHGAMLVANSIILAVAIPRGDNPPRMIQLALPILGIGITFLWFVLIKRAFYFYNHYWAAASKMETALNLPLKIMTAARAMTAGKESPPDHSKEQAPDVCAEADFWTKSCRRLGTSFWIIYVFFAMHGLLLGYFLLDP